MGGILAGAGEYVFGAALARGAFWGTPRQFFQLSFGAEVLWVAAVSVLVSTLGCSLYYFRAARKGRVSLVSPAIFVILVAAFGAATFYSLATVDVWWFYGKPRVAVVAVFLFTIAAWFCAVWGPYYIINKIVSRSAAAKRLLVVVLRLLTLALLAPFVVADVWALWHARGAPPPRPDIYLVVMDAFRADRLSCYGAERRLAPNLEEFAADAAVFREAFTVSTWTKPAIVSIFTATYPGTHGVNARYLGLPAGTRTLAEVLREGGYTTVCVSANPNVTRPARTADGFDVVDSTGDGPILAAAGPPVSCARLFRVFPWMRPHLGPLWKSTQDGVEMNRRVRFWRRLAGDRPKFFFIHYMEPHTPNPPRAEYLDELKPFLDKVDESRVCGIELGKYFFADVASDPAFVPDYDDDEIALARALYDADIRLMDVVIGDLLEEGAPAPGGGPEPVMVITADHGEEFLEHGRWLHGAGLHYEVARIPLLFRVPGCRAAALEGPVNLIDVPATLVSLAGGEVPRDWEGLDLTSYVKTGSALPRRELLLEGILEILTPPFEEGENAGIELNALVAGGYYYLRDENGEAEYLYDRGRDPRQENNLASDDNPDDAEEVLSRCRDALARWKRRVRKRAFAREEVRLTPELERQLKALGYIM